MGQSLVDWLVRGYKQRHWICVYLKCGIKFGMRIRKWTADVLFLKQRCFSFNSLISGIWCAIKIKYVFFHYFTSNPLFWRSCNVRIVVLSSRKRTNFFFLDNWPKYIGNVSICQKYFGKSTQTRWNSCKQRLKWLFCFFK